MRRFLLEVHSESWNSIPYVLYTLNPETLSMLKRFRGYWEELRSRHVEGDLFLNTLKFRDWGLKPVSDAPEDPPDDPGYLELGDEIVTPDDTWRIVDCCLFVREEGISWTLVEKHSNVNFWTPYIPWDVLFGEDTNDTTAAP